MNERERIEILARRAEDDLARKVGIPRKTNRVARVAVIRWVVRELWSKRQAGLQRDDAADLPVFDQYRFVGKRRAGRIEKRAGGIVRGAGRSGQMTPEGRFASRGSSS